MFFFKNKIVPMIEKSKHLQIGDYLRVDNDDDDMHGKRGTFVCDLINIFGEHVYMILLDENKHYSTYPKYLKKV